MGKERVIRVRAEPAPPGGSPPDGDEGVRRPRVYLHGGQVFASEERASVVTVLGSCVAVCLFDPVAGVGGMNHYLLPLSVQRERSARFGNVALATLLGEVLARGAARANLRAKVFGGAGVLEAFQRTGRSLGQENVDLALRTLAAERIPVVDGDVGGTRGRKVVFHVDDGAAWVRVL